MNKFLIFFIREKRIFEFNKHSRKLRFCIGISCHFMVKERILKDERRKVAMITPSDVCADMWSYFIKKGIKTRIF